MRQGERGAALLTVLLLVAVMAVIAAASLDRLRIATRLSGNSFAVDQARAHAGAAEVVALARASRLLGAQEGRTTNAGGWNGRAVAVPVPGGSATVTVRDGGNCFNLNGLTSGTSRYALTSNPTGVAQFVALMVALEVPRGEAEQIAASAADWIDSDPIAQPGGAEDVEYRGRTPQTLPANTLMADPSELRAVIGVTDPVYRRLRPWLCTLPVAELSPINVNTLLPEQAPLFAMLMPGRLTLARARTLLAERPANGYGSAEEFFRRPALDGQATAGPEVLRQVGVRTVWLALDTRVELGGARVQQRALVDARRAPLNVVSRIAGRAD